MKGCGVKQVRKTAERVVQELVGYAHAHGMDEITVRVGCRSDRFTVALETAVAVPPADLTLLNEAVAARKRPEIEGYYQVLTAVDAAQRLRRIGAMADAASAVHADGILLIRVEGPGQPD